MGWQWRTRVFKNSNFMRFNYGFSFQFNGLKPNDNQYFVENGGQTELQEFPLELNKSKLRMDNLVFPVHFEFGPSRFRESEKTIRYNIDKQFRLEDYYQWNKNWLIEARRVLKETGSIYLMTNWQYSSMFHSLLTNIFKVRSRIIWRNRSSKVENKKGWIDDTSDIWYATKSNEFIFLKNDESNTDINNINHSNSNLWVDIPRGLDKNSKYSQKLYLRMIKSSTYKLNWVLDPFMSIGDVGVASKVSGRRFIGFEKDKDSLLLAMKRIERG